MLFIYFMWNNQNKKELFYTTDDYPELKLVEENWSVICSEIPKIDLENMNQYKKRSRTAWNNKEADDLIKNLKSEWMQGWQGSSWYNFPLIYHGKIIQDEGKILCPKTIEILQKIPSIQIAGYSLLLPKSKLDVHTDETGKRNNSMAFNLLLTDNNANLYVDNLKHKHTLGKAIIFDSNIEHYADNQDNKIRVILYIDFKTDTLYGIKQKGIGLASQLGYPTVNVKLNNKIKCGMYTGNSEFGEVVIIVLKDNYAECHYKNYDSKLDNLDQIYIYNVQPIISEPNSIPDIYNKGCCSSEIKIA